MNRITPAVALCALAALPLLVLSSCETGYKRSKVVTPQPMLCTGDVPASITLYAPDDAQLVFNGKKYDLAAVEAASGVKFSNGTITYWNKGINATILEKEAVISTCTFVPRAGL